VRVRWLRVALNNLETEARYISSDNPIAAQSTVAAIIHAVENLKKYPAMGRTGRVLGTRELVVPDTPYIIPYRVRRGAIEILRVFHGARKWPEKL
jgi:toxin ParE1/3/4